MLTNCLLECAHLTITVSAIERYIGRKLTFLLGGFPSEHRHPVWYGKTRMVWLPNGEKILKIPLFILAQLTNVTDGRMDRHRMMAIAALCIASHGKNLLDWTQIQSRGSGHGRLKQKLDEHHPTTTEKWLRHVLRSESFCVVLGGRIEQERTRGRQSATTTDWMKSNDMECKHTGWLIKKVPNFAMVLYYSTIEFKQKEITFFKSNNSWTIWEIMT